MRRKIAKRLMCMLILTSLILGLMPVNSAMADEVNAEQTVYEDSDEAVIVSEYLADEIGNEDAEEADTDNEEAEEADTDNE